MYLLAVTEAAPGSKGEKLFANSSEFTNSRQSSKSGKRVYDAVVLPDPLQPDMMYRLGNAYFSGMFSRTAFSRFQLRSTAAMLTRSSGECG